MEISAASGTRATAGQSQTKLAEDFDQFLKLLTTQLQYQDPLDPMDSGEFTNQLVSFSQVEQSISTNKNLENLIAKTQNAAMSNAVGYLGKEITIETDRAGLKDGVAKWEYGLQSNADEVKISILDSSGKVVHQAIGENKAGLHEFNWNAPTNTPSGIYQLKLEAKTANDTEVQTAVYSKGIVESIETLNGEIHLSVNGIVTPTSNIQAVKPIKPVAEDVS